MGSLIGRLAVGAQPAPRPKIGPVDVQQLEPPLHEINGTDHTSQERMTIIRNIANDYVQELCEFIAHSDRSS